MPAVQPGATAPRRSRELAPESRALRQSRANPSGRSRPQVTAERCSPRSRCRVFPCAAMGAGDHGTPSGRLLAFGQDVAGDDDFLNLAGAVVNLGHLGVAEVALDVVAFQVAASAEDLNGV